MTPEAKCKLFDQKNLCQWRELNWANFGDDSYLDSYSESTKKFVLFCHDVSTVILFWMDWSRPHFHRSFRPINQRSFLIWAKSGLFLFIFFDKYSIKFNHKSVFGVLGIRTRYHPPQGGRHRRIHYAMRPTVSVGFELRSSEKVEGTYTDHSAFTVALQLHFFICYL